MSESGAQARLEVHTHSIIRGPRASSWRNTITHSHEGGDVPHSHDDTGPSCYTIDKNEWLRKTGLSGGGKKKFTTTPTGDQLAQRNLTKEELSFDIVICPNPPNHDMEGPGLSPAIRMNLAFGMKVRRIEDRR